MYFFSSNDPVLIALGAKNWRVLTREGASFSIYWKDGRTILNVSRQESRGWFVDDPEHRVLLPAGASAMVAAKAVLDDLQRRNIAARPFTRKHPRC